MSDLNNIEIPCIDGTMWYPVEIDTERWKRAYPAVNITNELAKMAAWADANPRKRKTRNGMMKFVNEWLKKSQDDAERASVARSSVGENKARGDLVPDYGNYTAHWTIGEKMIQCRRAGMPYTPPDGLEDYRTRFNVAKLIDAIMEREPERATAAFNVTLKQNWARYAR